MDYRYVSMFKLISSSDWQEVAGTRRAVNEVTQVLLMSRTRSLAEAESVRHHEGDDGRHFGNKQKKKVHGGKIDFTLQRQNRRAKHQEPVWSKKTLQQTFDLTGRKQLRFQQIHCGLKTTWI